MGVTGSRLIGLRGKDSDVDFVAYGRSSFELGRKKIAKGLKSGELEKPNLEYVYRRRKVNVPFEIFKIHEERKFNRAVLDGISFDLLYVRDYDERPPIPEKIGKKIGYATITAEVIDDRFVFDYPACYFVDHPKIEAILSFTHTFVGQAFKGEVVEAYGVVEEIDGKFYLIVGTLRECNEYIVSKTLLNLSNLEYEFERWKAKTFKYSSKSSLKDLKLGVDSGMGELQLVGEMLIKFLDTVENHIRNIKKDLDLAKVQELIDAIEGARSIFVMGAGRSGFVAKAFAMRLMHLGYNVYVVGETVTPRIKKEDLLIAISGSGETTSVVNISRKAKELIGSKLVAITQNKDSTLAKMSDIVVLLKGKTKTEKNDEIARIAPLGTMFELTALIFLDGLIAELMKIKNLTEKDLEARHAVLE